MSGMRSAPARSSSTARASAKRFFALVTSTRTRAPGRAPASSTTSCRRSRLSVTLCSRLSRNWATLLSRPLVALLLERFGAERFDEDFFGLAFFATALRDDAFFVRVVAAFALLATLAGAFL